MSWATPPPSPTPASSRRSATGPPPTPRTTDPVTSGARCGWSGCDPQLNDLVIRNGRWFDGTGAPGAIRDLGIRDGVVVEVSTEALPLDGVPEVVDADGCWVLPGFVDIHTHYDAEVLVNPGLGESVRHGVTTIVMGSCSLSTVLSGPEDAADLFSRVEAVPYDVVLGVLRAAAGLVVALRVHRGARAAAARPQRHLLPRALGPAGPRARARPVRRPRRPAPGAGARLGWSGLLERRARRRDGRPVHHDHQARQGRRRPLPLAVAPVDLRHLERVPAAQPGAAPPPSGAAERARRPHAAQHRPLPRPEPGAPGRAAPHQPARRGRCQVGARRRPARQPRRAPQPVPPLGRPDAAPAGALRALQRRHRPAGVRGARRRCRRPAPQGGARAQRADAGRGATGAASASSTPTGSVPACGTRTSTTPRSSPAPTRRSSARASAQVAAERGIHPIDAFLDLLVEHGGRQRPVADHRRQPPARAARPHGRRPGHPDRLLRRRRPPAQHGLLQPRPPLPAPGPRRRGCRPPDPPRRAGRAPAHRRAGRVVPPRRRLPAGG